MAKTRLQRHREREGLRPSELAGRAGLSPRTFSRLESESEEERLRVTEVSRPKLWNALNDVRREHNRPDLSFEGFFWIALQVKLTNA